MHNLRICEFGRGEVSEDNISCNYYSFLCQFYVQLHIAHRVCGCFSNVFAQRCKRRVNEELRGYLATIISRLSEKFSPIYWKENGFTPRYVRCGIDFKEWRYSPPRNDLAQCRSNANGSCSFVKFDCFSPFDSFYSASKVVHCPGSRKYSSESWFSIFFFFFPSEIFALKYSTRETLSSS